VQRIATIPAIKCKAFGWRGGRLLIHSFSGALGPGFWAEWAREVGQQLIGRPSF